MKNDNAKVKTILAESGERAFAFCVFIFDLER